MDGEQAPVAPALASEANQPTSMEQAAPETINAPTANIPADQIESFNKFVSANGGFEKAFSKLKNDVSNPRPAAEVIKPAQQQPQYQQPQYQQVPQAQYQQPQQSQQDQYQDIPRGYITQEEFALQQYFQGLSREEEYAPIADKIANGEVLREMAQFGIRPARNGMFNDSQVRSFLSLLAKTVPASTPASEMNNTPTVDYFQTGESISSIDEAYAVINDNMAHGGDIAEHPKTKEAKDFIRNYYANRH